MMSVDNLYWLLYENLLKPCGMVAWYYYPFGTTQNLAKADQFVGVNEPKRENHVLFHFDQEPLWTKHLGAHYMQQPVLNHHGKFLKILANSERSQLKKEICRENEMGDWYFFYHGIASRDWFRDAKFVGEVQNPSKVFSSYNHLVRDRRAYRMAMTARLIDLDLLNYGDISFHGSAHDCEQEVLDPKSWLSQCDRRLIQRHLCSSSHVPLILDQKTIDGHFSAHFGINEYKLWQNSLWHLVNETVFYDDKLHLTEKIFKPIVCLRPFLLVSSPGSLAYLRGYGFQTFDRWIDESYDTVNDHDIRLDMIASEISRLCRMTPESLRRMQVEMQGVLTHNKQHFFGEFGRIVINELVENFDTCLRVWNNGRVDGRERPLLQDRTAVKESLLQ